MAATPRFTSGRANVAEREARIRSVLRAASKPPPKQMPFTAEMMGFLPVRVERPAKPEDWVMEGRWAWELLLLLEALSVFHSIFDQGLRKYEYDLVEGRT